MNIKPMLCKTPTNLDKELKFPCHVQPKLNGVRAIFYNGEFYSRDMVKWNSAVVAHVKYKMPYYGTKMAFDGEFYRHGMSLQTINSAIGVVRVEPKLDTSFIQFHIFDTIPSEGNPSFTQRHELLMFMFDTGVVKDSSVQLVETAYCDTQQQVMEYYSKVVAAGYEGAVVRCHPNIYCPGKRRTLRLKAWKDMEGMIVGYVQGKEGKYQDTLGALVVEINNFSVRFEIGSFAITDEQRNHLWLNRGAVVGMRCKFKYEMLSDTGVPLKPCFLAFV